MSMSSTQNNLNDNINEQKLEIEEKNDSPLLSETNTSNNLISENVLTPTQLGYKRKYFIPRSNMVDLNNNANANESKQKSIPAWKFVSSKGNRHVLKTKNPYHKHKNINKKYKNKTVNKCCRPYRESVKVVGHNRNNDVRYRNKNNYKFYSPIDNRTIIKVIKSDFYKTKFFNDGSYVIESFGNPSHSYNHYISRLRHHSDIDTIRSIFTKQKHSIIKVFVTKMIYDHVKLPYNILSKICLSFGGYNINYFKVETPYQVVFLGHVSLHKGFVQIKINSNNYSSFHNFNEPNVIMKLL